MSLDIDEIAQQMLSGAAKEAASSWNEIKQAAAVELQGLAQRLVLITEALTTREITKEMAERHFDTMRYHAIATMAMLTVLTESLIAKVVNAALTVVRDVINNAIGFTLIT